MAKTTTRPNMEEAIDKIVGTCEGYLEEIQRFTDETTKPRKQMVGSIIYRLEPADPQEINREIEKAVKMCLARIGVMIGEYSQAEREFQTLHGEAITSDMQLLKEFNLNIGELKALAEKYQDNFTMYQAVQNHAEANKLTCIIPMQTPEQRTEILNSFWKKIQPRFLELTNIQAERRLTKNISEFLELAGSYKSMALKQLR